MKEGTPRVDDNLIELYYKILMDKLSKPEEWKVYNSDNTRNRKYISSPISPKVKTCFQTDSFDQGDDADKINNIFICSDSGPWNELHSLPVNSRKLRRLIRNLHNYMLRKEEWEKYEKIDISLKKALPDDIDRFLKITKIKKNL
jgi:hypothetical protein